VWCCGGDLDEPQRIRILAEAALVSARLDVDPGDPLLEGVLGHGSGARDTVRGRGQSLSDTGAFGEVLVISAAAVALDMGAGSLR
jgi:hypothetical protein